MNQPPDLPQKWSTIRVEANHLNEAIQSVERLTLGPDELLVVKVRSERVVESGQEILNQFRALFDRLGWDRSRVIVADDSMEFLVVKNDEPAA